MTDLSDAIANLCNPIIEHIPQQDDDGKWLRTHTVTLPSLLQQLANAVNPSSNTDTGSSSSSSSRNPINGDALFEYAKISSQIGDWCRIAEVARTKDPVVDLQAWHDSTLGLKDWDDSFYVRKLRAWARSILNRLNPPKRIELTVACPVCGKREWFDDLGEGALFPVVVEYPRPEDGESIKPHATCRACKTVWEGMASVEELAEEIQQGHADKSHVA